MPIPVVDFSGYEGDAPPTQRIYTDHTFNTGATYDGVWYIDGNVTIEDFVDITGTVVATGNINMGQSSNVNIVPSYPYPALISGGNIIANQMSDSYIKGLIYAAGDVNNAVMNNIDTVTFFGTIIAGNNLNMNSANDITITYDPTIVTNPPPHFG